MTQLINLQVIDSVAKGAIADTPYIFITDFNDSATISFYQTFLKLHSDPNVKVIPIVISSYGGQVHSLLAMLDIMKTSTKPVSTIALGKAMSCGAVLLSAGTRGYRFASEHTDIMIHEVSTREFGKISDIENGTKSTIHLNKLLFRILQANSTLKDANYLLKKMKSAGNVDWYLTAREYRKMGLIDHVAVPNLTKV
jgi:ATP-dependent Clp protease protease subunit